MSAQVPVWNAAQPNCKGELKQVCTEMDQKKMQEMLDQCGQDDEMMEE